jgi:hypothetical protein
MTVTGFRINDCRFPNFLGTNVTNMAVAGPAERYFLLAQQDRASKVSNLTLTPREEHTRRAKYQGFKER